MDAIKHIQPLMGEGDPMLLDVTDGQITVRAGTDDKGRSRDQVHADLEGDPLTPAFNPGLLLRTLQQIDAPFTQFGFTTATKPVVLHAPEQADIFRGLVMPIRVTQPSN
ncbi:hypothetical protein ACIPSE_45490 [Streptomyces sp. NPDC090106]|uniref:hypothetical protein n=1 Tax=Streptomyces sp. NPDC090106 TaxID=3365946 RepID=UPI0038010C14